MRRCDERGGATTTTTAGATKSSSSSASASSSSSSSVKMAEKTRRGSRRYLSEMLNSHYSRSNHFYNESCDFSDYSAPRSSDSSLISTFRCRSSKHESEKTRNDAVTPPWNQRSSSPYRNSPWTKVSSMNKSFRRNGLIGSILSEEGHIYSLAVSEDLIYTGSDSKNIRVWKNLKEFSGFKSSSGLVKAIVLSGDKIFTGHQDGKIRVWRATSKDLTDYKRVGSLPNFRDFVKKSFNPKNYVEVRRHRNVLRIKHYDAVSCLSLNEERGLLYSGSWDRTLKVWRVSDSKCVDSVNAHDDAVNAVVTAFDTLVFTGSADGTVKVWRREFDSVNGKSTGAIITHSLQQVLLKQENAVTALAANAVEGVLYCGASDGLLNYWECGKKLSHGGILKGHKLAVLCLEAAGRLVFSGGADKSICMWRRGNDGVHTCLSVLSGHTGPVKCLAVQAEDDHEESSKEDQTWVVYSGSLDKTVKVWRVSEQSPDFRKLNLI
ncbi:hypothetical protein QQ045_033308 [Rhodiola kirilowii]